MEGKFLHCILDYSHFCICVIQYYSVCIESETACKALSHTHRTKPGGRLAKPEEVLSVSGMLLLSGGEEVKLAVGEPAPHTLLQQLHGV